MDGSRGIKREIATAEAAFTRVRLKKRVSKCE